MTEISLAILFFSFVSCCVGTNNNLYYRPHNNGVLDSKKVQNNEQPSEAPMCYVYNENARFDCRPEYFGTIQDCTGRGCCYDAPLFREMDKKRLEKNIRSNESVNARQYSIPWCYYPTNYDGYRVTNTMDTTFGFTSTVQRTTKSGWPSDILKLQLDVYLETQTRLHFKLYDPSMRRYEVPLDTPKVSTKSSVTDYDVKVNKDPFGITVTRKSTGAILFDSALLTAPLIFADQFIQISTHTGTGLVYGLGEHKNPLLHKPDWSQLAFWARDNGTPLNTNLYGVHPFYLSLEADSQAHGVFLLNSNAMEVLLQPLPALTFRTIGGILDFYVFTGSSPDFVIQQYTDVIGKPFLPPYWSLGFHLCRYGYGSAANLTAVIKRNRALGIPYEVQWNDIDYMDGQYDWSYDKKRYADLPAVVQDIHNYGQKYIIIIDPAIGTLRAGSYPPYDDGIKMGVFVLNSTGQPLVGAVWPGPAVFPDWTNPKTVDWWYMQAKNYHDQIPFDSLWTDMNEPSNFVFGSEKGCPNNNLEQPPYVPYIAGNGKLADSTICASAKHYYSTHYNLHSLYGHTEAIATHSVLTQLLNKRSIVITRSSFAGTGHYAGHWSGDNIASWGDLYYSIPLILNMQMYGVSLVGADICGFSGNTNEELCIRWTQLGAFYPFMRNHNDLNSKDQDPAVFSHSAQLIMKAVLNLRYALLPYMYTAFVKNHVTGTPVVKPLVFEFPTDYNTYDIDRQFLWGNGLLISPALEQNQTVVNAYFPRGVWYDMFESYPVWSYHGRTIALSTPLAKINVHVRGGAIIPMQTPAVTTVQARQLPFGLIVALNESSEAQGDLIWDDGENLDTTEKGLFTLIEFVADKGKLQSSIVRAGYKPTSGKMPLGGLRVLGLRMAPQGVQVNGKSVAFTYHDYSQELLVEDITADLLQPLTIIWL